MSGRSLPFGVPPYHNRLRFPRHLAAIIGFFTQDRFLEDSHGAHGGLLSYCLVLPYPTTHVPGNWNPFQSTALGEKKQHHRQVVVTP